MPSVALGNSRPTFTSTVSLCAYSEESRQLLKKDRVEEVQAALTRWLINAECAENVEGRVWARNIKVIPSSLQYTNAYIVR